MRRTQNSPGRYLPAEPRPGRGPLGALPHLSRAARRALVLLGVLTTLHTLALVVQAVALCSLLAEVVTTGSADYASRLGIAAGAVLARGLLGWAVDVAAARAAAGAKEELRGQVLDAAHQLGPEWIAARGPAELGTLCTRGLDALDAYFTKYLPALVTCVIVPPAIGAVLLFTDPLSAGIVALTLPLLPLFAILVGKYTADRVGNAADDTERLSAHLHELIRGLPVLAAFRRAAAQRKLVREAAERYRRTTMANLRVAFSSAFVLELAATLSVALVAVGIGLRLVTGDLTLAIGLTALVLAPECYLPLRTAGAAHHASEDGVEAVRRVTEILQARGAANPTSVGPPPTTDLPHGRKTLRVQQLTVDRADGPAPAGESFELSKGEIHLLDTPSGSGKSTTIAALLGFVQPSSGNITVNNIDKSTIDLSTWRQGIGWVPQRPAFAGGTARAELELALADRKPGDPRLLTDVATELGIAGLLDRPVSELSAGERQRLAVARALLRCRTGAWLLLLDEPTAHLDAAHAELVQDAIQRAAAAGAAVVLATHRAPEATPEQPPAPAPDWGSATPAGTPHRGTSGRWLRGLFDRRLAGGIGAGAAALICGIALTATSAWLIAKASEQPPILTLSVAVVGVRTFGLARAALRYLERLAVHDAAFRIAGRLRERLWDALVRLGPARTTQLRGGEGLRRLTADVDTVRDLVPRVLAPPFLVGAVCLTAVAVQAIVLPGAGLGLAVALLVAGLGAPALAVWAQRQATSAMDRGRIRVAAGTFVSLDAAAELLACGADRQQRARLAAEDAELARQARRQAFAAGTGTLLITLATGAAAVYGAAQAAVAVAAGALLPVLAPLPVLVPLALAETLALLPPAAQQYQQLRAVRARVAELTETPPPPAPATSSADIRLDQVDVRWPGASAPALREVTLHIPRGTHVAIVGPSGAGKSTLLALLLGFLTPDNGRTILPGHFAWCPQDAQLMSTTIRENLKLADPHASETDLAEVLELAGLAGWSPDRQVGTGGATLSGGEASRLALARTLLAGKTADALVLDEPTAHLDRPTARAVLDRLRTEFAGKTVLHVTHRAEEAAEAEMLIEVNRGRVQVVLAPDGIPAYA